MRQVLCARPWSSCSTPTSAPADEAALTAARRACVVVLGTVAADSLRNAELVLPVTTMAEENGTYVNRDRRIQRYQQAKSQPGMARPAWWVAGEVLAGPGPERATRRRPRPRRSLLLGERWPVFAGLTHADLGYHRPGAGPTRRPGGEPAASGGR